MIRLYFKIVTLSRGHNLRPATSSIRRRLQSDTFTDCEGIGCSATLTLENERPITQLNANFHCIDVGSFPAYTLFNFL